MTKSRTQKALEAQNNSITQSMQGRGALVGYYNDQVEELMRPESVPVIASGEAVPTEEEIAAWSIKDTLENPDTVAIDASTERTQLLAEAGALEIGIDAATSIQAKNSLERMLAHQLALCHVNGMRLMTEAMGVHPLDLNAQALQVKKMNLAARLIDTYQRGFDTLTKARTAGRQTITVKKIQVTGGQTVIADKVTTKGTIGLGEGGRQSESEYTP